jgi:hypothetical protein
VNDLVLWRTLGGPDPLADDLVPLLEELSARRAQARLPFVGRLIRAARDERPRVRAAALAGLSGQDGAESVRAVVRGLDDAVPHVAAVAVEALRAACHSDPWRIVHALFHAEPAIRRATLTGGLPPACQPLVPYLIDDAACVQDVLPRLAAVGELPGFALFGVLDRHAAGQLSAETAADLLGRIPPADLVRRVATAALREATAALRRNPADPSDRVTALLGWLGSRPVRPTVPPYAPAGDRLPEIMALVGGGHPAPAAVERHGGGPFDAVVRALHEADETARRGIAVAAAVRLLAPSIDECLRVPLVRLLVAAWPAAALWRWIDVPTRRGAVDDFLTIPADRLGARPYGDLGDDWLTAIDESDLIREAAGGTIDVRALAGLARLVGLDALERVLHRFRVQDLVAGLLEPRAGPFLTVPGAADRRFHLLERVRGDDRGSWPRRLAHLVPSFNRELLPLLSDFTPAETLELLTLLQLLDPPAEIKDPRGRRLQGVADDLGRRLTGAPRPAAGGIRAVSSGPRPGHFVIEAGPHVTAIPVDTHRRSKPSADMLGGFVGRWREGPRLPPLDAFLRRVFLAAVESLDEAAASLWLASLDAESLRFLLFEQFVDDAIPASLEADLRAALADRERPPAAAVAAMLAAADRSILGRLSRLWSTLVGGTAPALEAAEEPRPAAAAEPPASAVHTLTAGERAAVIAAAAPDLPGVVRPFSTRPTLGLADALACRTGPQPRGVEAAAAILLGHDPLRTIDRALAAFLPAYPSIMCERLDAHLAHRRSGDDQLPFPLHAWLWRWEWHLAQGLAILAASDRTLADVVAAAGDLTCRPLAARLLEATQPLADATVAALSGPVGPAAAAVLVTWSTRDPGSGTLAAARRRVLTLLPGLPGEVRAVLEPWVSSRGLEEAPTVPAPTHEAEFYSRLARGAPADLDRAIAFVVAETGRAWFTPADWDRLIAAGCDERALARRLALARQPHAYSIAVESLLTCPAPDDDDLAALAAFLEQGDARLEDLRILAARLLLDHGDPLGLPLLLADETDDAPRTPRLFAGLSADTVADLVRSALAAGGVRESVLAELLLEPAVAADARAAGLAVLLAEGTSDPVRERILPHLARSRTGTERVRRVVESFAWGIRRGLELTGRLFTVEMIAGTGLGYTRLHQPRVFVNPLPILRGERHAEAVVRGLVIHEVGHHVHHADDENLRAAEEARREGFFRLLNLVQDEHLERNLRAVDPALGDPLKRLAAYAFQHSPREIPVRDLLEILDDQAFAVLTHVRLAVARQAGHVVVQAGRVLRQLEERGRSFPRFVRALRMGLGLRGADERCTEAMALFGPGFRHSSGTRLLEIARELRRIFGDELRVLDLLGSLDAPTTGLPGDPVRAGEGVTNGEIQREVERVLAPPSKAAGPARPTGGGRRRLQINVSPEEEFDRITTVERVPFDPVRSADYRRRVARPAARLRRFFEQLGFTHQLDRQRLQGRLLDRSRLLALALRGEPRVMVSRRLVPSSDLFLGVAVDCSGSMGDDDNIEKARLFAELLAESVRGCRGIDLAVCGFNDSTIFDAGSAARCAAHALDDGGGNNDAAGLWHVAEAALASRRRAKLLVMISDGLPTECSVTALRKLVEVLTHRHGMCCAQVAVRPLEEECFPIHVRLDEDDLAGAVSAFGRTVMRLVQRAIGAGG